MRSKVAKRIIPAAIQCFAEHGYHGTTTKEIAVAADVAESSLFLLYRSKENLFEEALKTIVLTQMTPEQYAELLANEGNFRDVLQAAIRRWYSTVSPEYARMAMFAALSTPKLARTIVYGRVRNIVQQLADAIDRYHGRRRGSKASLVRAQTFMFGLFYFRLTRAVVNGEAKHDMTEREYLRTALDNFFEEIKQ